MKQLCSARGRGRAIAAAKAACTPRRVRPALSTRPVAAVAARWGARPESGRLAAGAARWRSETCQPQGAPGVSRIRPRRRTERPTFAWAAWRHARSSGTCPCRPYRARTHAHTARTAPACVVSPHRAGHTWPIGSRVGATLARRPEAVKWGACVSATLSCCMKAGRRGDLQLERRELSGSSPPRDARTYQRCRMM